jgi:undecaprenyl diphosphate synthase
MDGNGRWARGRFLPRSAGHREGAVALRRVLEAAPDLGIRTLTVYALSSDNWQRPRREVQTLLHLLRDHLREEMQALRDRGVRLSVIGRRDRLPGDVREAIEDAEALTAACADWRLRIAVDYSSRQAILGAAARASGFENVTATAFSHLVADGDCTVTPDVDLLIRTGGEQRLSDFLLWECAYAELYFTPTLWPDFDGDDLAAALADYHRRDRRFGRLTRERPVARTAVTVSRWKSERMIP